MTNVESYNLIDLLILGILLVTLVLGLWKGFLRSLTAVAGVVVGVVGAIRYHPYLHPYLAKISALDPQVLAILSMIVVFILVQVVFVLVRKGLDALISVTRLSWLDRALGAAMGVLAGFLIVASAVQAMLVAIPEWSMMKSSRLLKPVEELTIRALSYAPREAREQLQSLMTKWKGMQDPAHQPAARQSAVSGSGLPVPPPVSVK